VLGYPTMSTTKKPSLMLSSRSSISLLSANEIRLAYGYQNLLDGVLRLLSATDLLDGVTLAIAAGEKIGLVGRNGCGKTSF
jgi:ABC transport system ATP-binding/permease protein